MVENSNKNILLFSASSACEHRRIFYPSNADLFLAAVGNTVPLAFEKSETFEIILCKVWDQVYKFFFDMYSYKPANEVRLCFVKKTLNNERSGRCFSWECVTGKSLMVTTLTRICIWILKITKFDGECTTKKQLPYSWKTRFLE